MTVLLLQGHLCTAAVVQTHDKARRKARRHNPVAKTMHDPHTCASLPEHPPVTFDIPLDSFSMVEAYTRKLKLSVKPSVSTCGSGHAMYP